MVSGRTSASIVSRRMHLALLVVVAICGSLYFGLAHGSERPNALIMYPDATQVSSAEVRGTDQLTYHVDVKYPASPVIGLISDKLRKAGWEREPPTYDFLNPDSPSSPAGTWEKSFDARKHPTLSVYQWLGDWKDASRKYAYAMYFVTRILKEVLPT